MKFSIAAVSVSLATLQASLFQANALKEKKPALRRADPDGVELPSSVHRKLHKTTSLFSQSKSSKKSKKSKTSSSSDQFCNKYVPTINGDEEGSPQRLALDWLENDAGDLTELDQADMCELFSVAVLYFSMGGPGGILGSGFLSGTDPCEFDGVTCTDTNNPGKVTGVNFREYIFVIILSSVLMQILDQKHLLTPFVSPSSSCQSHSLQQSRWVHSFRDRVVEQSRHYITQ
jgi:hypothetical protein